MKAFFGVVLSLFVLAAFVAVGWMGWMLWKENRSIRAEKEAIVAERARFVTEKGGLQAELTVVSSDREQLQRNLLTAWAALEKAEAEQKRLQDEKEKLEAQLVAARRLARENLEKVQKVAAGKAPVHQGGNDVVLEDVGSLEDLLDMTDKAPRRAMATP